MTNETETTTAAVDTAANDVRKDVENEVKSEVASDLSKVESHLQAFGAWTKDEVEELLAWGKLQIEKL